MECYLKICSSGIFVWIWYLFSSRNYTRCRFLDNYCFLWYLPGQFWCIFISICFFIASLFNISLRFATTFDVVVSHLSLCIVFNFVSPNFVLSWLGELRSVMQKSSDSTIHLKLTHVLILKRNCLSVNFYLNKKKFYTTRQVFRWQC